MEFNEKVLTLTSAIPKGKVLNYGEVAYLLGKPNAARAVGYALNSLPFGSDVPWHRVVGKSGTRGKISIRSFSYSRDEQVIRLEEEGIELDEHQQFPLINYLWQPDQAEVLAILEAAEKT